MPHRTLQHNAAQAGRAPYGPLRQKCQSRLGGHALFKHIRQLKWLAGLLLHLHKMTNFNLP